MPFAPIVTVTSSPIARPPEAARTPALIAQPALEASAPVRVKTPEPCIVRLSKFTTVDMSTAPRPVPSSTKASTPSPPSSMPVKLPVSNRVTVSAPAPAPTEPVSPPASEIRSSPPSVSTEPVVVEPARKVRVSLNAPTLSTAFPPPEIEPELVRFNPASERTPTRAPVMEPLLSTAPPALRFTPCAVVPKMVPALVTEPAAVTKVTPLSWPVIEPLARLVTAPPLPTTPEPLIPVRMPLLVSVPPVPMKFTAFAPRIVPALITVAPVPSR